MIQFVDIGGHSCENESTGSSLLLSALKRVLPLGIEPKSKV